MVQLVNVIDDDDKRLVERCIGNARNIIWRNIAIHELLRALRLDAYLLMACGLTGLFFDWVPPELVFAVLSLPWLWTVASACSKRPARLDAANRVDERYATCSLLATAMELLQPHERKQSEFAPWIVRQAARTVEQKLKRLDAKRLGKPYQMPWLEMGLLMLGVFLIFQPGKINTVSETRPQVEARQEAEPGAQTARTDLIAEIRKADLNSQAEASFLRNQPDASSSAHRELVSSKLAGKMAHDEAAGTMTRDENASAEMSTDVSSDANLNIQAQQSRQSGIGADADHELASTQYETRLNGQIQYRIIPLQHGQVVSDNRGSLPYNDVYRKAENRSRANQSSMPNVKYISTPVNSVLTFGQQQYVTRYFKQIASKK